MNFVTLKLALALYAFGPIADHPTSTTGAMLEAGGPETAAAVTNQERWVYFAANGGGFGWREPPAGSIPSTIEVISRTSAPIQIAGREARWSYYTVRLNCAAQTTTVTSHVITTEVGEHIANVPEGPKPISSDTPPQAAGMVICNRAALPGSQISTSRESMLAALRGRIASAPLSTSPVASLSTAPSAPRTVWEEQYMSPLEPLYLLAPDAPNAAFYRSLSRPAEGGRHEMWVVAVLRGVANGPAGAYDLGASLYSIDCTARTTQVLRGRVYRDMAAMRDTPIEPVVPLQPGTVSHQMIIQVCDGVPLPPFAGSLSQVRRAVPLG